MSFPSKAKYFAERAESSRRKRDAASDPSVAFAHGELANRYQAAFDQAHGAENAAAQLDECEREERALSDGANNEAVRDFHHETANRHSHKASSIRSDAEVAANAVGRSESPSTRD